MTHVYAPTYQAVKMAQVLENPTLEGEAFVEAQMKLAAVSFDAYERVRLAASQLPVPAELTTKEAMVVRVAELALAMYDDHADTGAKVAAVPEYVAHVLQKLASAVFVDEMLLEQLPSLEGDTKLAAEQCRALGREYIVTLFGEILK